MTSTDLEVLFSPAEFAALNLRDLSQTTCVVFDILRATTTMVTALAHGATAIHPVSEISEALALREKFPEALLAGERNGLRIRKELTGSIDFDLGNSPREFTAETVKGRRIIITTTNGTRALQACAHAKRVLVGSFHNLEAVIRQLTRGPILLICAGTYEEAAYEDTLAAGAVAAAIERQFSEGAVADSARIAAQVWRTHENDLAGGWRLSKNACRLLSQPDLAPDVPLCFERRRMELAPEFRSGEVR